MSKGNIERLKSRFPYVYAWGRKMGSYGYYIEKQMLKAEEDNAPKNAIFKRDSGEWATTDRFDEVGIQELNDYLEGRRGGVLL